MKYRRKTALAAPLGRAIYDAAVHSPLAEQNTDMVVPLPLSAARRAQRGFNQAELLALAFCKQSGLPLCTGSLVRSGRGPSQTKFGIEQRRKNIQGLFMVRCISRVEGKTILLIDDVITTTATVREAAGALMDAGAKRVLVAAAARAV